MSAQPSIWHRLDHLLARVRVHRWPLSLLIDGLVIALCWNATYLFRLGFERWWDARPDYDLWVMLSVIAGYLSVFVLGGIPRGMWRFSGFGVVQRPTCVERFGGTWRPWADSQPEPTLLEVMSPQRASLDVGAVSADVDVQQMAGRKLDVSSVSGNVVVTASSPGEASFENVSGDTTLRITTNKLDASSVSGDLRISGGISGEVDVESVSGNVELAAKALDRLEANSVSGDTRLDFSLRPGGNVKAETLSGELDLTMPKATGAKLNVETFSGDINSPTGRVEREEHGPGATLETTLGDGRGRIDLESFSGDVRINLQ